MKVLEYFFAAAREQKKIVNLHTKGGERQILDLLERYDVTRPIIHWYSGPMDILRALVQFGAYFTVGVEVLYSETIQAIAREIPDHLLLTETDNPGGIKWLKGVVGMPSEIKKVIPAGSDQSLYAGINVSDGSGKLPQIDRRRSVAAASTHLALPAITILKNREML